MSRRIDRSWLVFASIENPQHDRCVDLFRRPDGSYGFEEFRRDPEDAGGWTPVLYFSGAVHPSAPAAFDAAVKAVAWLAEESRRRPSLRAQSTAA
ncbi:MAG: hypothetical protein KF889_25750 [Alphaproteobacteria bacterium]|nr:hypothetical protein [Alphaproteobacteria bacterium]MCW5739600.1 hypothetical protein [Alphaproteobacteria bacterium]